MADIITKMPAVSNTKVIPTLSTISKGGKSSSKRSSSYKTQRSSHPPTTEMVTTAIKELNEKKGSSLQAIKKFIIGKYNVDIDRMSVYIRKYLKSAVESGAIIQTKGTGANGSFKLAKIKKVNNTKKLIKKKSVSNNKSGKQKLKKSKSKKKNSEKKKPQKKKYKQNQKIFKVLVGRK